MTNDVEPSLIDLFLETGPSSKLEDSLFESSQTLTGLRDQHGAKLPEHVAKGVGGSVADGLGQVLKVPMSSIFAGAWNGYRSLREYADPKKHPPEEILLVPFEKHTINSTHKPHLDVLLDGVKIKSIEFEVKLVLEIETAVLKIQAGRIREIQLGGCKGKGTLLCEGAILLDKQSKVLHLPGALRFEKGIPIRPTESVPTK